MPSTARWLRQVSIGWSSAIGSLTKSVCALCGAIAAGLLLLTVWVGLTVRVRWFLWRESRFPRKPEQTEPIRTRVMRPVSICFMECDVEATGPAAIVRFTAFDEDGKPAAIRQIEYDDSPEGIRALDEAVERAVADEIDLTVLSPYSIDYFPSLYQLVDILS